MRARRAVPVLPSIALVALAVLCGTPALAAPAGEAEPAEEAIRGLVRASAEANNAGDVAAWVALFADDAVYMPPNAPPVTTREGLVEIAEAGFRHQTAITIEPLEIQVCGDWAFARTQVSGTVRLADSGETVPVDVKQIVVYARGPGGGWKIARMIGNSNRS